MRAEDRVAPRFVLPSTTCPPGESDTRPSNLHRSLDATGFRRTLTSPQKPERIAAVVRILRTGIC